ncbi:alpha/beta hydrolase [Thiorhodococcus drewsii]|uniref:alpha/beta hydrolase n=1 Tax=Thiorhodococcus drewsii TaxID=210408 RepID=UPI001FE227E7|nr:alpha/beta hydrolase [Thiorhodococcus drewsii]
MAACLALAGCFGPLLQVEPGQPRVDAVEKAVRFGSSPIAVETGAIASRTGCALDYSLYRPDAARTGDLVILGHGFLRSRDRMAGLAESLASTGLSVATLDFCNVRPWDGSHVQNGFDMMALADALGAKRVVYAGFSAGALAALVAGRNDPRALGVVTLDLVDADGIGRRMASGMERPLIGLFGDPSSCNAYNNGLAVYAVAAQARILRFSGADHCDFESPTDWLCRLVCGRLNANGAARSDAVLRAATDAIRSLIAPG